MFNKKVGQRLGKSLSNYTCSPKCFFFFFFCQICLSNYTRTKKKRRVTFTKKKRGVTFTDSFKVFNVMLHSMFFFLNNLSSLLNKLTKFHSIFSDNYEKKIHPLTVPLFVYLCICMYPAFLFRPSIYRVITVFIFLLFDLVTCTYT